MNRSLCKGYEDFETFGIKTKRKTKGQSEMVIPRDLRPPPSSLINQGKPRIRPVVVGSLSLKKVIVINVGQMVKGL